MRKIILAICLAALAAPLTPAPADPPHRHDRGRWDRHDRKEWRKRRDNWRHYQRYDYNRFDPRYGYYDAGRYYRDGRYYRERRLGWNDRIYRGRDGRYYCRRSDGTTGLIIGAIGGGVLGNALAPGDSNTLGTLLGAGVGAALGRSIDRDNIRCR